MPPNNRNQMRKFQRKHLNTICLIVSTAFETLNELIERAEEIAKKANDALVAAQRAFEKKVEELEQKRKC